MKTRKLKTNIQSKENEKKRIQFFCELFDTHWWVWKSVAVYGKEKVTTMECFNCDKKITKTEKIKRQRMSLDLHQKGYR